MLSFDCWMTADKEGLCFHMQSKNSNIIAQVTFKLNVQCVFSWMIKSLLMNCASFGLIGSMVKKAIFKEF